MCDLKKLKLGVIGVSNRGKLARLAHKPDENVELVAGADIEESFLQEFKEALGKDTFVTTDYKELLARSDIDAVFVCTPDNFHEEHAVAVLEAGKALYLEKPMAITVDGCDRVLETAYRTKQKLFLGHNMRYMAFVMKMKEIIEQGHIGEVKAGWCRHFVGWGGDFYFKDWHADRRNTTSLLLQKGAHDLDILHWLCGGYTTRVNAMGKLAVYGDIKDIDQNPVSGKRDWSVKNWPPLSLKGMNKVIDVEDISMLNMELNNGVLCTYQQCHFTPDYWRNYTIIGTEGRIENFGNGEAGTCIKLWNRKTNFNAESDVQYNIPVATGEHAGADPLIVSEFIEHLRNDCPIRTSPVAARNAVAAGCLATQSLRNGGVPQTIPEVSKDIQTYFAKVTR